MRTRKYRCRYPFTCGDDGLTRHCYEVVPADEPDAPGRCNDDPGEDPDWKPETAVFTEATAVALADGLEGIWRSALE